LGEFLGEAHFGCEIVFPTNPQHTSSPSQHNHQDPPSPGPGN
jgi:hypothetical protein